jgi:hypothetical protein
VRDVTAPLLFLPHTYIVLLLFYNFVRKCFQVPTTRVHDGEASWKFMRASECSLHGSSLRAMHLSRTTGPAIVHLLQSHFCQYQLEGTAIPCADNPEA